MSRFNDDLVGGAVVLIVAHLCFDFCKFLVDKLATMAQPSPPTVTGFTNPLNVLLVNESPQPAGLPWCFPFPPPAMPLPHTLPRIHRRTYRSRLLPEAANTEVVVRQREPN